MCLFPAYRTVQDKYTKLHKLVKTTCGRCPECLSKKRLDWFIRLKIELANSTSCYFITLTYNDEHLPHSELGRPCFSVRDVQLFMKRYRKHYEPIKLRYFLIGEYGGQFGRPHYHAIIFNLPNKSIYELNQTLAQIWDNGYTSIANVTDSRLNYVCKYCIQNLQGKKSYSCESEYPPFLSSRNPGIGCSYVNDDNVIYHLNNETVQTFIDGKPYILPRYLKDKIFSDYPDIKDRMTQEYLQKKKQNMTKFLKFLTDIMTCAKLVCNLVNTLLKDLSNTEKGNLDKNKSQTN